MPCQAVITYRFLCLRTRQWPTAVICFRMLPQKTPGSPTVFRSRSSFITSLPFSGLIDLYKDLFFHLKSYIDLGFLNPDRWLWVKSSTELEVVTVPENQQQVASRTQPPSSDRCLGWLGWPRRLLLPALRVFLQDLQHVHIFGHGSASLLPNGCEEWIRLDHGSVTN